MRSLVTKYRPLSDKINVTLPLMPYSLSILFSSATRPASPQQHEPITVGPHYLTHPVNFLCEGKPEYPERTHDFRQSVDYAIREI